MIEKSILMAIAFLLGFLITAMMYRPYVAGMVNFQSNYAPDQHMSDFEIKVHVLPREQVNIMCQELARKSKESRIDKESFVLGCAGWDRPSKFCVIVVPEPISKTSNDSGICVDHDPMTNKCNDFTATPKNTVTTGMFAVWGHELMHCVKGSFHD